jgi:hypothetical protein
LPLARVSHLASHLLARVARRISDDWRQLYEHPIFLLETFIEPARFGGICYRAANWLCLGLTTGRGQGRSDPPAQPLPQGTLGPAPGTGLSPAALPGSP